MWAESAEVQLVLLKLQRTKTRDTEQLIQSFNFSNKNLLWALWECFGSAKQLHRLIRSQLFPSLNLTKSFLETNPVKNTNSFLIVSTLPEANPASSSKQCQCSRRWLAEVPHKKGIFRFKHSQSTLKALPKHSRRTPNALPVHSQRTLKSLPKHSQSTAKALPKRSKQILTAKVEAL